MKLASVALVVLGLSSGATAQPRAPLRLPPGALTSQPGVQSAGIGSSSAPAAPILRGPTAPVLGLPPRNTGPIRPPVVQGAPTGGVANAGIPDNWIDGCVVTDMAAANGDRLVEVRDTQGREFHLTPGGAGLDVTLGVEERGARATNEGSVQQLELLRHAWTAGVKVRLFLTTDPSTHRVYVGAAWLLRSPAGLLRC